MTGMTRRGFLKFAGAAAAATALAPSTLLGDAPPAGRAKAPRPNIVFLFADDMGYGDPRCFNAESKCPTPNIDRLAGEGMKFTDAHAPVGWCVPSRYGLLTGRYPFRSDKYKLRDDDATVATVLKSAGYRTHMVGKWHLGFKRQDDGQLRGGPVDRGFDSYFGIPASLDIPPYYYIENDRAVAEPTGRIEASHSPDVRKIQGAFWREGGIAPGFKHDQVLPTFRKKALGLLDEHAKNHADKPLFLYLALPSPHTPWLPGPTFRGKSKCGEYGDYVVQVDDVVGAVLDQLDKLKMADDTLVIFTSDNGPVWFPEDVKKYQHRSVGALRGMKSDVWEGGNRMPFVARWPGRVKPGAVSEETICFTDMMATFAELGGAKLGAVGEDSFSIVPALLSEQRGRPIRDAMVLQAGNRMFAIRQGKWKLILGPGPGGFSKLVKKHPRKPKIQLYDLSADIGERKNLHAEQPEVVARLTALLNKIRKAPRSAPIR